MTELDLVMNNIYIVSSKCCPNYIAKWCSQNSDGEKARGEGVQVGMCRCASARVCVCTKSSSNIQKMHNVQIFF